MINRLKSAFDTLMFELGYIRISSASEKIDGLMRDVKSIPPSVRYRETGRNRVFFAEQTLRHTVSYKIQMLKLDVKCPPEPRTTKMKPNQRDPLE